MKEELKKEKIKNENAQNRQQPVQESNSNNNIFGQPINTNSQNNSEVISLKKKIEKLEGEIFSQKMLLDERNLNNSALRDLKS